MIPATVTVDNITQSTAPNYSVKATRGDVLVS